MNRVLLGALGALMLVAIGVFWWQGRAIEAPGAPPPDVSEQPPILRDAPTVLPSADASTMTGPKLPEAVEMTKEQKRFARYDRNNDSIITRNEMLATRVNAFRKLDVDGNNLLTFEEWAVSTVKKFEGADGDRNGRLSPGEFATTRPKPRAPATRCAC
ncbi:EF-hand domain-containing protein [Croceicoccus sp. F390]|uniref:EF-hand domain-containing protein n=1 Tax=Croceicoccus esteveae TaxID=3075597 RepID=A0ABU2ZFG5_9SPHN|nr:EF-hand domain-containing protein [Croceicoccus sp. F390]MDT0574956.1 EF-hand domain-containing protein [Croceicoccus sp. F390]